MPAVRARTVDRTMAIALEARRLADKGEDGLQEGAAYIARNASDRPPSSLALTPEMARQVIYKYVQAMLEYDHFEAAATLLWGPDVYDWRPLASRDTWRCLFAQDKLLIQGAGAMGKSFCGGAWFYLDWFRDPEYTAIKVVSLTREHAERNIFASIKTFHRQALVRPPTQFESDLVNSIQVTPDSKQGIHLVAIPRGESGHGTLRGFHPSPRFGPAHRRWGRLSRTMVVLDEAEEIPAGVWEGCNNILSSVDLHAHPGSIKIFAASNPKDRTSEFGQRCEPSSGWGSIDIEDDHEWESREGWHVLRLDAARCENVKERKLVYAGLQTYEGYMSYVSRGKTAEAMTMARGWFPDEGISMGLISPVLVDNAVGIVRFIGAVTAVAGFDLALEGNDQTVCSYGRWGLADGWTGRDDKFHPFPEGARTVLQLDSQVPFPKAATIEQAQAIQKFCKTMKVEPRWVCVDRTGNGSGVHDALKTLWSEEVMGVNYSWAATDAFILGDDSQKASELYDGVVTELLFGLTRYMEFGWLKISPGFRAEELTRQATGRRYRQKGLGKVRVESKGDYRKRTGQPSPDALDSLSLLVYLLRQRGESEARMMKPRAEAKTGKEIYSVVDADMNFVDFSL